MEKPDFNWGKSVSVSHKRRIALKWMYAT
ncbi:hypothetical protein RSAG8_01257, partial [Rhizoctonia solani AG-8 WAC10335]